MNKFTFLVFGASALLAACSSRPANQFNIKGDIDGVDGQTICLSYMIGDSIVIDSAVVKNGAFEFIGNIDVPVNAGVYMGVPEWGSKTSMTIYLEPSEMSISGLAADDFSNAVVAGSKTNDEMRAYDASVKDILAQMNDLRKNKVKDNDSLARANAAIIDSLRNLYNNITIDFIKNNPASFVSAGLLDGKSSQLSYDELKSMYESLSPEVQGAAKEAYKELAALAAVQPGEPAPELEGTDPSGKLIRLSDLKGKIVLVDFWATWCVPCRASLPHVKELYNKYHDKGFEVFCVGDDDANAEGWKKVIIDEGMENYYNILRGLKSIKNETGQTIDYDRSNDMSDRYAVHFLPTKYLIAADGTIIGKMDRNDELDAKLEDLFKEL